jgi:predicted O-methyltransferase YrrM
VPVRTPSAKPGYAGRDFTAYVETIDRVDGAFDLVVVDGRARVACAERALPRLAPGGVLLLDDAWRRRYRVGIRSLPATAQHLPGPAPSLPYPSDTALLRPRA